jgi:NAD(P)-dependent dehydrogenase (short-subunit alcohol dehydrogenase family)
MVANAGVSGYIPLFESMPRTCNNISIKACTTVTTDQWDRTMNINARGVFLCYKYAGLQMINQGHGGRIIGASSIAGKKGWNFRLLSSALRLFTVSQIGSPFNYAYTASKFAVRGLTQAAGTSFARSRVYYSVKPQLLNLGLTE